MPENRENPNSRHIELHFIKLNSTWDDEDDADDEDEYAALAEKYGVTFEEDDDTDE